MFSGALTALATPFRDGNIDYAAYEAFIQFQLENGIDGLVVAGSTGEAATLTDTEKLELGRLALKLAAGSVPVILGTGNNNTQATYELTKKAADAGFSGVLLVAPYYNKPTQEGLFQHYARIAEIEIPQILYNVPGRTASHIAPQTVARLVEYPNIVAIKEASGGINNTTEILRHCGDRITVLSGEDTLIYPLMCVGAKGVICTTSNVAPKLFHDLCAAAATGDHKTARALHFQTYPLIQTMFVETNPIPVKYALSLLGLMTAEYRLPLTPPSVANQTIIAEQLRSFGLIP